MQISLSSNKGSTMAQINLKSYLNPNIKASTELANVYPEFLKYSKKAILSKVIKIKNVNPIANVHLLRGEIFDLI
jgi:hypothetical protein